LFFVVREGATAVALKRFDFFRRRGQSAASSSGRDCVCGPEGLGQHEKGETKQNEMWASGSDIDWK
jgi:hypothetical protein